MGGALTWWGSYFVFRRQERARRREEGGRLAGAAMAALRELEPDVFVERLQLHERGREMMVEKWDRWLSAAGGLDVLRVLYPSGEVATLVESLIVRGRLVAWRLDEQVTGRGGYPDETWLTVVGGEYLEALDESERLIRLVQSSA